MSRRSASRSKLHMNRDPEKHKKCCGIGLERLLPALRQSSAFIELFLVQRNDSGFGKPAAARLLRFAAPGALRACSIA